MGEGMILNGWNLSKAEVVSMVAGRLIDELILRSHREGEYRHYYDIALLGYSGTSVYSLLGDELKMVPITELAVRKVRRMHYALSYNTINRGRLPMHEEVSMWVEPRAQGNTPMFRMITTVTQMVEEWCAREENRDSFPPLVFNVTDGEASDGSADMLRSASRALKQTATNDGNTLFVNVHITANTNHAPVIFPNIYEVPISIRQAHLLADISSIMPEQFHRYIGECRHSFARPPYIAMSYNASMSELVAMLNIGSRTLNMGI